MKKGDLLEITLRIVQESLKDKDSTKIESNCKIKNTSGRLREFDIAINSDINGFELLIVIECKDYAKPVSVEKIEAFHSKCLRIPSINKKIFVSRNGFQNDAINAANDFGIECYNIEYLGEELIKQWFSVSLFTPLSTKLRIDQARFWAKPELNFDITFGTEIIDEGKKSSLGDFIYETIKESGKFPRQVYFSNPDEPINEEQRYSFEADSIEELYIINNSKKYYVKKIFVVFTMFTESIKGKVTVERIKSGEKEMSTVITHDTDGPECIKLVLKDSDPNKFDPFFINKETGEIVDSGFTFEYRKDKSNKN